MLSEGSDGWADVDYFFAQVSVDDGLVDFKPTCGNILSAVGPAALEMGLVSPQGDETEIRIQAVNTGAKIIAVVKTPDGQVEYEGTTSIDGVPGTAAPIALKFMEVVGSSTGAFLPTGNIRDIIQGIEVTCMDVTMPMVIVRASDFGLKGDESPDELDANRQLFDRIEAIRIEAGARMGMGDVSRSVTPKFGLLSPASNGGTFSARYFMPWKTHISMAVTGAQCLASCVLTPGTVADGLLEKPISSPASIEIEHPSGSIDVLIEYAMTGGEFRLESAGITRTARKIADGNLYIPSTVWAR